MTSMRLACAVAVLIGCARSTAEPDQVPIMDPVGEADAALPGMDSALPSELTPPQASTRRDAAVDANLRDATANVGLDASTPKDAAVVSSDGGPTGGGNSSKRSVKVDVLRDYLLYVPNGLPPGKHVPLVSVHHPYAQDGEYMADITTWKQLAEREGFAVAFPEGGGPQPWNVGQGACGWGAIGGADATQDDITFLRELVKDAQNVTPLNLSQVFVVGLSMGGYFANHVACQGRDIILAAAAHSGGTYAGDCPGNPVPVMLIHGDADSLIPLSCATDALGYWATRNGCSTSSIGEPVTMGQCQWNTGCPAGREIGLCTMKGMDHGWAGAKVTGGWLDSQYGGGEQYENAAEMMWKFFKKYL